MHYREIDSTCINRLAKWKREAEAWYKQDSAMFGDLLHTVEKNVVRKGLTSMSA